MGRSTVNTTSTAIDNRLAVTDSGVGLSSSGTGNAVNFTNISNSLDGGAIAAAFDFASSAGLREERSLKELLGVVEGTFDKSANFLDDAYKKSSSVLADAYKDSKGGAVVLQQVTIGLMVTIAAVAYFWLSGKR